jgi:hypothetical protein
MPPGFEIDVGAAGQVPAVHAFRVLLHLLQIRRLDDKGSDHSLAAGIS